MTLTKAMEQATFTVQLGCLIENGFDIGLKEYPIFDEDYRVGLNEKIINHYFFREIGAETPALFRFFLNRKMNEIMPFYNELYKTTLYQYDPLINMSMTTEGDSSAERADQRDNVHDETHTSDTTAGSTATSEGRTVLSNTPQMQLSGRDDYATSLTDTTSESGSDSTGHESITRNLTERDNTTSNASESYITKVIGLSGITGADAIMRLRETILNIDMLVIDELAGLFMGLYTDYANVL